MAQTYKGRISARISKADSRQQGVLLANHYAQHWLQKTPVLLSGEIADIAWQMRTDATRYKGKDPARSRNSDEIACMLQAQHNLCFCLSEARVGYAEVKVQPCPLEQPLDGHRDGSHRQKGPSRS